MEALMNLGAGFDITAFRLPNHENWPIWEIDQRINITAKEKRLRKALGTVPTNVRLIALDFDHNELGEVLMTHGYSICTRTFFLWEAVTQYLTEQCVRATFKWLAQAVSGSRLIFTYVCKDFLQAENLYGWKSGYKRFVDTNIWNFGMLPDHCPVLLKEFGWRVVEDVGYDELASRYIRPTGRRLTSTAVERIVYDEKI
jgi:methyltransferase (TIGR00027 family)